MIDDIGYTGIHVFGNFTAKTLHSLNEEYFEDGRSMGILKAQLHSEPSKAAEVKLAIK